MSLIVGVDVGGTNTDAVIIERDQVLYSAKTTTTENVTAGVANAIASVLQGLPQPHTPQNVTCVHIGTTHFVNAIIQKKDIVRVAVLRLCGAASRAVPPFCDFPEDLKRVIAGPYYFLDGGYQYDGSEIGTISEAEIKKKVKEIEKAGIKNLVIAGIFAPVCDKQEQEAKRIIHQLNPHLSVTLSHEVGLLGLLERENAAILNESLKPLCKKTVTAFHQALQDIGLKRPLYLTLNDGTIISAKDAVNFPVFTIASGPTNSMRGAAHLSNKSDAIVIDIGGTTTDVGVLMNGFPRQASTRVKVGGVHTNFHMPDVLSFGLGGGSIVKRENEELTTIGPLSVGYRLTNDALVFGGDVLTATDIAVAAGHCGKVGDKSKVAHIAEDFSARALETMTTMVENVIDQVKIKKEDQPVILVGGGSILIDREKHLKGASDVTFPPHYEVANAVGAALSKVSGTIDRPFRLEDTSQQELMARVEALAREAAIKAGADPSKPLITVEKTSVPMSYLPGNATRIKVKVVGDLAEDTHLQQWEDDFKDPVPTEELPLLPSSDAHPEREELPYIPHGPVIDPDTGDWLLDAYDVDCIAIGAGIMGCGGGGNPYIGKLRAVELLKDKKELRVIHPDRLGTTPSLSGPVCVPAFLGAPVIVIEKLLAGAETIAPIQALKACMVAPKLEEKEEDGVTVISNVTELMSKEGAMAKPFNAVACAEIGGLNSMEPLTVGAKCGIPVVDADGMGRAFPELQMFLPFVRGCDPFPAAVSDENSNVHVISHACGAKAVENFFRKKTVEFGCCAGFSMVFSGEEVKNSFVKHSLSRARRLGDAVLKARRDKTSPLESIIQHEGGKLLFTGKIVDVQRRTSQGFNKGTVTFEGDQKDPFFIEFQNEHYLAYFLNSNGTKRVLASVPDLIAVVDSDMGEPIATEELRYGLRVAIIAMPCNPMWTTPEAMEVVGPAAFGYSDVTYESVGKYVEHFPIPRTKMP